MIGELQAGRMEPRVAETFDKLLRNKSGNLRAKHSQNELEEMRKLVEEAKAAPRRAAAHEVAERYGGGKEH